MSGKDAPGRASNTLRLEHALGAALIVLAVPASAAMAPVASVQATGFRAPEGPLVLTREVRRTLADGQQLVVRRRYLIRISPGGGGYMVNGELAGVEVEAPAAMADLAEVERQRADLGLFPLQLDATGLIIARPSPAETVDAARARMAVSAYLARTDLSAQERTAAQAMAARLQAQGQAAGTAWPADLFHPAAGPRTENRVIALPDGRTGEVSVTVAASHGSGGLLTAMERRLVTRLDGTERLSLERWTLADAR